MRVPMTLGAPATRPRRVFVEQHGCATTAGEAQLVRGLLAARGHQVVASEDEADAAVLVTCTVVDRTERTMVRRMREIAARGLDLVVTGCMAGAQVATIKRAVPEARVLPPAYVHQVAHVLDGQVVQFCHAPKVGLPKAREGVVDHVVISEGCSGACSFCLTKIARPGLRSYPVEEVAQDVAQAVAEGAREIRLTSQDTAAYGWDAGTDLARLLRAVCEVPGDFRVRVGMMNPFALERVLDDLVEAFAHPKVFRFLHLPLQSGSDRVLAAMARGHDAAQAVRQVSAFRVRMPDLVLATDVIVGFPGETEEDVAATIRVLERLEPDIVNVTRFSPRPGTPAARMPPLAGPVVKARSRRLTAWRDQNGRRRFGALVGSEVDVLVTEPGKPGTVLARTDAYRQVVLPEAPLGSRGRARVVEATPFFLTGAWRAG